MILRLNVIFSKKDNCWVTNQKYIPMLNISLNKMFSLYNILEFRFLSIQPWHISLLIGEFKPCTLKVATSGKELTLAILFPICLVIIYLSFLSYLLLLCFWYFTVICFDSILISLEILRTQRIKSNLRSIFSKLFYVIGKSCV